MVGKKRAAEAVDRLRREDGKIPCRDCCRGNQEFELWIASINNKGRCFSSHQNVAVVGSCLQERCIFCRLLLSYGPAIGVCPPPTVRRQLQHAPRPLCRQSGSENGRMDVFVIGYLLSFVWTCCVQRLSHDIHRSRKICAWWVCFLAACVSNALIFMGRISFWMFPLVFFAPSKCKWA